MVLNPQSGKRLATQTADTALRVFRKAGREARVVTTRSVAELRSTVADAVRQKLPSVIVVGGDGSLHHAATELRNTQTALAVLPCGRGNDFCRHLGIPMDTEAAAETVLQGFVTKIDLGRVNEHVFITVASVGFDADIAERLNKKRSRLGGTLPYLAAVVTGLAKLRSHKLGLSGDFGRVESNVMLVATANTRSYGGGMMIAPEASSTDGLFDVCVIHEVSLWNSLKIFSGIYSGKHVRHPRVQQLRTKTLSFETDHPMAVYADGEPCGVLPTKIWVEPQALNVIAPMPTASV
jgi:diacylglycerol kinase (ATP)